MYKKKKRQRQKNTRDETSLLSITLGGIYNQLIHVHFETSTLAKALPHED